MRYHFTVSYSNTFDQVSDWLRRRAADDPLMALGDGARGQNFVVVTADAGLARWQQEQLDAGRSVAEGVCVIEIFPEASALRFDLECGEEEHEVVASLLQDLVKMFPDFSAYDEDRHEDITDLVRSDVKELFKSEIDSPTVAGE